jgi:hypothetical protein
MKNVHSKDYLFYFVEKIKSKLEQHSKDGFRLSIIIKSLVMHFCFSNEKHSKIYSIKSELTKALSHAFIIYFIDQEMTTTLVSIILQIDILC